MDVAGLYPNILHDEGLSALRKGLAETDKKGVPTDTLVELAGLVLKNNIFDFNEKARLLGQSLICSIVFYLWQGGKNSLKTWQ